MSKFSAVSASGSRRLGVAAGAAIALTASVAMAAPAGASASTSIRNGVLTIQGNAADDRLTLRLAQGAPDILQLDIGDDGTANQSFNRNAFTSIRLAGGGGRDQLRVDQVNGAFADEDLTFDGGAGSDRMIGGDDAELFLGRDGNDSVDGNNGDDVALLGAGNDTFTWDPGDDNDTEEGQAGVDTLDFNGANVNETMDLSANGQRVRFFRDIANVVMDLNDVERLDLAALGGTDSFTVNDLSGTDMRVAGVDLSATGGGGDGAADTIVANGTNAADSIRVAAPSGRVQVNGLAAQTRILGSEAANDRLQVNGLAGNDEVSIAGGVAALINVDVDLGADQ